MCYFNAGKISVLLSQLRKFKMENKQLSESMIAEAMETTNVPQYDLSEDVLSAIYKIVKSGTGIKLNEIMLMNIVASLVDVFDARMHQFIDSDVCEDRRDEIKKFLSSNPSPEDFPGWGDPRIVRRATGWENQLYLWEHQELINGQWEPTRPGGIATHATDPPAWTDEFGRVNHIDRNSYVDQNDDESGSWVRDTSRGLPRYGGAWRYGDADFKTLEGEITASKDSKSPKSLGKWGAMKSGAKDLADVGRIWSIQTKPFQVTQDQSGGTSTTAGWMYRSAFLTVDELDCCYGHDGPKTPPRSCSDMLQEQTWMGTDKSQGIFASKLIARRRLWKRSVCTEGGFYLLLPTLAGRLSMDGKQHVHAELDGPSRVMYIMEYDEVAGKPGKFIKSISLSQGTTVMEADDDDEITIIAGPSKEPSVASYGTKLQAHNFTAVQDGICPIRRTKHKNSDAEIFKLWRKALCCCTDEGLMNMNLSKLKIADIQEGDHKLADSQHTSGWAAGRNLMNDSVNFSKDPHQSVTPGAGGKIDEDDDFDMFSSDDDEEWDGIIKEGAQNKNKKKIRKTDDHKLLKKFSDAHHMSLSGRHGGVIQHHEIGDKDSWCGIGPLVFSSVKVLSSSESTIEQKLRKTRKYINDLQGDWSRSYVTSGKYKGKEYFYNKQKGISSWTIEASVKNQIDNAHMVSFKQFTEFMNILGVSQVMSFFMFVMMDAIMVDAAVMNPNVQEVSKDKRMSYDPDLIHTVNQITARKQQLQQKVNDAMKAVEKAQVSGEKDESIKELQNKVTLAQDELAGNLSCQKIDIRLVLPFVGMIWGVHHAVGVSGGQDPFHDDNEDKALAEVASMIFKHGDWEGDNSWNSVDVWYALQSLTGSHAWCMHLAHINVTQIDLLHDAHQFYSAIRKCHPQVEDVNEEDFTAAWLQRNHATTIQLLRDEFLAEKKAKGEADESEMDSYDHLLSAYVHIGFSTPYYLSAAHKSVIGGVRREKVDLHHQESTHLISPAVESFMAFRLAFDSYMFLMWVSSLDPVTSQSWDLELHRYGKCTFWEWCEKKGIEVIDVEEEHYTLYASEPCEIFSKFGRITPEYEDIFTDYEYKERIDFHANDYPEQHLTITLDESKTQLYGVHHHESLRHPTQHLRHGPALSSPGNNATPESPQPSNRSGSCTGTVGNSLGEQHPGMISVGLRFTLGELFARNSTAKTLHIEDVAEGKFDFISEGEHFRLKSLTSEELNTIGVVGHMYQEYVMEHDQTFLDYIVGVYKCDSSIQHCKFMLMKNYAYHVSQYNTFQIAHLRHEAGVTENLPFCDPKSSEGTSSITNFLSNADAVRFQNILKRDLDFLEEQNLTGYTLRVTSVTLNSKEILYNIKDECAMLPKEHGEPDPVLNHKKLVSFMVRLVASPLDKITLGQVKQFDAAVLLLSKILRHHRKHRVVLRLAAVAEQVKAFVGYGPSGRPHRQLFHSRDMQKRISISITDIFQQSTFTTRLMGGQASPSQHRKYVEDYALARWVPPLLRRKGGDEDTGEDTSEDGDDDDNDN